MSQQNNKQNQLPANKQPTLKIITHPNDANVKGDIFGGWLMSQMDIAGALEARKISKGKISTVAVKSLQFINPLFIRDLVSFYVDVIKVGNTSITTHIEVFSERMKEGIISVTKIADAEYVYVAVESPGVKRQIPK